MRGLVELLLSIPALRRKIINRWPRVRAWCASALGSRGNLPIFEGRGSWHGDVLYIDYASTDQVHEHDRVGPIDEWMGAFIVALERAVLAYPERQAIALALHDRGAVRFPLHFCPISKQRLYLTETYVDGDVEEPFFAYLENWAQRFVNENAPPATLYILVQVDPKALYFRTNAVFGSGVPEPAL